MSRDYFIFNFNGTLPSDEIMNAKGYHPPPLGTFENVRRKIESSLKDIEWSSDDPTIGHIVDKGYVIEFDLVSDDGDSIACIAVQPHGIATAEPFMQRICHPNEWYVWDPQMGEWIAPSDLREDNPRF